jgi:hypothetical protein
MRKAVETLWEISPLQVLFATAKNTGKMLHRLAKHGLGERFGSRVPCSRFVTYYGQK